MLDGSGPIRLLEFEITTLKRKKTWTDLHSRQLPRLTRLTSPGYTVT